MTPPTAGDAALDRAPDATRDAAVHAKAVDLVRLALEMTTAAGSGHPTSAASLAHLVTVLLYEHMRWTPDEPDHPAGDRLVLSEGHACPIVYAAGADLGLPVGKRERHPMTREDALELRAIDSPVDGHPNPAEGFPFFPAATGSLGQGLSVSVGLALAARHDDSGARVFCLIGDGESREGQVWEAVDALVDQALGAVCPIFNCNAYGQTGEVSAQQSPETLAARLTAAGMEPLVLDGHAPGEIRGALERHAEVHAAGRGRPVALVARTVKGWGTPSLAKQPSGKHGQAADAGEELETALAELDAKREEVGARWTDGALRRPARPPGERPEQAAIPPAGELPSLADALRRAGAAGALEKRALATRKAYGHALRELGRAVPDVFALDADVSNSTHSEKFADDEQTRARFVECRIAEQHMASCAAGLAAGGKRPFASTFGKFLSRAYDQIEMALVGDLPVRFATSHVGVSLAADGPSQMALSDAAWFASLGRARRGEHPLMYVLTPADAWSAYALTFAMARHDGASVLRTLRPDTPFLYEGDHAFELGGHRVLREGGDLVIASWGYMLHECLKVADALDGEGLSATVLDLYSLPFDGAAVSGIVERNGGCVLTVEDNYGGALGAAVAEALAEAGSGSTLRQMFVRRVPKSGREPDDVLAHVGLSRDDIAEAARACVTAG